MRHAMANRIQFLLPGLLQRLGNFFQRIIHCSHALNF